MTPIPGDVRAEAALLCAIAASGGVYVEQRYESRRSTMLGAIGEAIGAQHEAIMLALEAFLFCFDALLRNGPYWLTDDLEPVDESTLHGEAEALLRTGWSP